VLIYKKIFCILYQYYYKFDARETGRVYFIFSLLTFLESSILVPILLIIAIYSRVPFNTKLWGLIVFVMFGIINYYLFIKPPKDIEIIKLCNEKKSDEHSKVKLYIRLSYVFIFILFAFSLIVEGTKGYLFMVPVYLREFLK